MCSYTCRSCCNNYIKSCVISVTCVIMQKNGAGLHTASSCYWDNQTDGQSLLQTYLKMDLLFFSFAPVLGFFAPEICSKIVGCTDNLQGCTSLPILIFCYM